MDLNLYRFVSHWQLNAPPADVFGILEALETYPAWWPEIRLVEVIAPDSTGKKWASTRAMSSPARPSTATGD